MTDILSRAEYEDHVVHEPDMRDTLDAMYRYINFLHASNIDELKEYEELTILLREKGWIK